MGKHDNQGKPWHPNYGKVWTKEDVEILIYLFPVMFEYSNEHNTHKAD